MCSVILRNTSAIPDTYIHMASSRRICAVVGVGPGIGRAVALRFAKEGYNLALLARRLERIKPIAEEIKQLQSALASTSSSSSSSPVVEPFSVDATDPDSVTNVFKQIEETFGDSPHVLIYNAGSYKRESILNITPQEFEAHWKANCFGAFLATQKVLPKMVERKEGTIILTGATASLRGSALFSCLAVGKFGLRAFGQSLAREFAPKGIHVAHVIIDGQVDNEYQVKAQPDKSLDSFLKSESIAEEYWRLHVQDKTTWTHELELRPYVERW
jgi:NAD(P)-dependent dehydrogenase (short-subunit alcohol dehydrogenase family)